MCSITFNPVLPDVSELGGCKTNINHTLSLGSKVFNCNQIVWMVTFPLIFAAQIILRLVVCCFWSPRYSHPFASCNCVPTIGFFQRWHFRHSYRISIHPGSQRSPLKALGFFTFCSGGHLIISDRKRRLWLRIPQHHSLDKYLPVRERFHTQCSGSNLVQNGVLECLCLAFPHPND